MVDLVTVRITFGIVILPPPSKVSVRVPKAIDVLVEISTVYKIHKVVDFACAQTYSMNEYFWDI